ncbi:MAG TPA: glutathione S-transferase [Roseomonas sp.]|jgi:glutathione S-transferase
MPNTLYYAPGACSMGIHVILEEIGKPYELSLVNMKEGAQYKPDYVGVNPKSKVPALKREDGSLLTEFPVIAAWLAKSNPDARLIPTDLEGETRAAEAMAYFTGTIHPYGFTRQYRPGNFTPSEADLPKVVETGKAAADKYFSLVDTHWNEGDWVLPSGYSVADAALFFVEYWASRRSGMTLPAQLAAHLDRMLARPAVQRTLQQEGLAA